jgi:lincosamide nucleotidyltransferase A/C/D/E
MTAADVVGLYRSLEERSIRIWLDGGWSVDAALGRQSRAHADLDIAIEHGDLLEFRAYMQSRGRELDQGKDTTWNFVPGDDAGREVDVHVFRFDEHGHVVEGTAYPDGSLTGVGSIEGHAVRCIDPAHMVALRARYVPTEKDIKDVSALCEKFGISYPAGYEPSRDRPGESSPA